MKYADGVCGHGYREHVRYAENGIRTKIPHLPRFSEVTLVLESTDR